MAAQRVVAQGSKVPGRKESGGEIEGSRTKGVWFPRNALLALQGEFRADFVLSCVTGWTATFRSSSRNHLKDVPDAIAESQHVTYSHCELGGHWMGGHLQPSPASEVLPVVTA